MTYVDKHIFLKSIKVFWVIVLTFTNAGKSTFQITEERANIYKKGTYNQIYDIIKDHPSDLISFDSLGSHPLIRVCDQENFSQEDIINLFKRFLEIKKDINVNLKHKKTGKAPLHIASAWGKTQVVEWLLDNNANINIDASDGATPLIMALSFTGNTDTIIFLISKGADVNLPSNAIGEDYGTSFLGHQMTPLHWAAQEGNVEYIKILLANKANINTTTEKKKGFCDFLENAFERKKITREEINLLLDNGKQLDGPLLSTPLLYEEIKNENADKIKELLDKSTKEQIILALEISLETPNLSILDLFKNFLSKEYLCNKIKNRIKLIETKIIDFQNTKLNSYKSEKSLVEYCNEIHNFDLSSGDRADRAVNFQNKQNFELIKNTKKRTIPEIENDIFECNRIIQNSQNEINLLRKFLEKNKKNDLDPQILLKDREIDIIKPLEISFANLQVSPLKSIKLDNPQISFSSIKNIKDPSQILYVRNELTESGKTQQQIAEELNVGQPTVSRFLSGKNSPKIMKNYQRYIEQLKKTKEIINSKEDDTQ